MIKLQQLGEYNESKKCNIYVVSTGGSVRSVGYKSLAQDTVESLPGVKSVDNRLKIKDEHPAEKSDVWITAKVKATHEKGASGQFIRQPVF